MLYTTNTTYIFLNHSSMTIAKIPFICVRLTLTFCHVRNLRPRTSTPKLLFIHYLLGTYSGSASYNISSDTDYPFENENVLQVTKYFQNLPKCNMPACS